MNKPNSNAENETNNVRTMVVPRWKLISLKKIKYMYKVIVKGLNL